MTIDNGALSWAMVQGGGKSQTSTGSSSVSIPPDVLARYNSVNSQAQTVAQTPFQQYSADPNAFVAGLMRKFGPRRAELLAARVVRQHEIDAGKLPDFLPETAAIRGGDL